MKKITLKISAFLLLAMFALQVQGQALYTVEGTYKISTSGLTPNLYLSISPTTGDLIWAEEILPDNPTQLWTIQDHVNPSGSGFVQITANVPGPGDFTMIVDQSTITIDPATNLPDASDKDFRISVRPGVPVADEADANYGFDQFQRRKTKVNAEGLADANGTNPENGNNALFVKPLNASGGSRYGVVPSAAGEDVLFDGGGIDVIQYHLVETLSAVDFDASSIFISNPVSNELSIKGLSPNIKEISVYSLLGKRVLSRNLNQESSLTIDTSALSTGMYIVKIASDKGSISKKIVKQ